MIATSTSAISTACAHCGEPCKPSGDRRVQFCCTGCQAVYSLLNREGMSDYYCLNETPGVTIKPARAGKFDFLNEPETAAKLISFKDNTSTRVTFYLPQIHCSSCVWLLENLQKINTGIYSSRVNFMSKMVTVNFNHHVINLSEVASLLTSVGYEPHISLQNEKEEDKNNSVKTWWKLGLTGFCFANIMLISFPEYLGLDYASDPLLTNFFRFINLLLSIPVLLIGGREFYENAFNGFRQRQVNIDAPIALAISITFCRSVWEICTGASGGYLDSMSGIIFFMLIGRTLQQRTFSQLEFNRSYRSYFSVNITVLKNDKEKTKKINLLEKNDVLLLRHLEIVPVDCILSKGEGVIDNSFVTGESAPVNAGVGDIIYAGGKIAGGSIEAIAIQPFEQSSFTRLWENGAFAKEKEDPVSFVTIISRYFSLLLLLIATTVFIYWQVKDPANAWNAATAVLIVACPCTLLLSASFSYGFIMQLLAGKGIFFKNTAAIEKLAAVNKIVFDKTGTLTETEARVKYEGVPLSIWERNIFLSLLHQSIHPLCRAVVRATDFSPVALKDCREIQGKGMRVVVDGKLYKAGSAAFVQAPSGENDKSRIFLSVDGVIRGSYAVVSSLREGMGSMLSSISGYDPGLLSGDNRSSLSQMGQVFPSGALLLFNQSPQQKLDHIQHLQQQGNNVLMIGDGLNDAGALKQADIGISLVEDVFSFTPACDAVMNASLLQHLSVVLKAAKAARTLISALFIFSLLYNVAGIWYSATAQMAPMIAAILMPASSISVVLLSALGTRYIGWQMRLPKTDKNHLLT
ncbi:heavy metal translocating P-type ATPase metal-binding domain-containing protein [Ferruginibacter sp. HRS2-29]|uniref:heavy metal translocating P-type ATPase n=1 Tax=Ferruginibacter sp. HRS2-29 TaxID=2487334 RepID=UPI0020CE6C8D|nr:heavy metal translocating P-type ATPase metal-binding domain-containing protein [Ferruginibacter sp. HRS2-29]MCP9752987.1 HAD family hydrolase [Ferruginibacter sp. HRS2-29]